MSGGTYKPTETHKGTLQSIRVWRTRLQSIIEALGANDLDRARAGVGDLRETLRPEVYPEFADNLNWLYRSTEAHIDAGKLSEAAAILESLRGLLEGAAGKLQSERSTQTPFPPSER